MKTLAWRCPFCSSSRETNKALRLHIFDKHAETLKKGLEKAQGQRPTKSPR